MSACATVLPLDVSLSPRYPALKLSPGEEVMEDVALQMVCCGFSMLWTSVWPCEPEDVRACEGVCVFVNNPFVYGVNGTVESGSPCVPRLMAYTELSSGEWRK